MSEQTREQVEMQVMLAIGPHSTQIREGAGSIILSADADLRARLEAQTERADRVQQQSEHILEQWRQRGTMITDLTAKLAGVEHSELHWMQVATEAGMSINTLKQQLATVTQARDEWRRRAHHEAQLNSETGLENVTLRETNEKAVEVLVFDAAEKLSKLQQQLAAVTTKRDQVLERIKAFLAVIILETPALITDSYQVRNRARADRLLKDLFAILPGWPSDLNQYVAAQTQADEQALTPPVTP